MLGGWNDYILTVNSIPDWFNLLQLSLASGERRTEVFIHSLEMGHTAGTRAVKAMGECCARSLNIALRSSQ